MKKIRVILADHGRAGRVVADFRPGEVREVVEARPCPACAGRGLRGEGLELERCEASGARRARRPASRSRSGIGLLSLDAVA